MSHARELAIIIVWSVLEKRNQQDLVFNKTIIPLVFVGYEMILAIYHLTSDARCEIIVKYCGNGTKTKTKHSRRLVSFRFTRPSLFLHSIMGASENCHVQRKLKKKKAKNKKPQRRPEQERQVENWHWPRH